jgi:hypothetical protein
MPRIDVATPAPDELVYEATDCATNPPTAEVGAIYRGGKLNPWGVTAQNILGATLGAPGFGNLIGNRWWRIATSGAGGKGEQSTTTPLGGWPIGMQLQALGSSQRLPTKYEFDILLMRTPAPLALDVPFGVTLLWTTGTQNLLSLAPNTWVGYEISSRSTVNAGNWTLYRREVSTNALANADTGIHPDAGPLHVLFRYWHVATNPQFDIVLNGTTFVSFVGLANLLQPLTYAAGLFRIGVTQNSVIAGQTDGWVGSHLKITRLPGFGIG